MYASMHICVFSFFPIFKKPITIEAISKPQEQHGFEIFRKLMIPTYLREKPLTTVES